MSDRFAWIKPNTSEVIDGDHLDAQFWAETFAHEQSLNRWPDEPTAERVPERTKRPEVPSRALALSPDMAAEALSVSRDFFDAKVKPHLRIIIEGGRIIVPVAELERYLTERAAKTLRGR